MRLPTWVDGLRSVGGFPQPCIFSTAYDYQTGYDFSAPVWHHSRITIKHAVSRLLAGGLLFFTASVTHATVPVGATPGTFAVSPSGAATYSIPIFVPPGTNSVQPKLSLNYNSQGGNGLLGMGWSIGGLSVIHRCGATIAIDGFKGGVNYDVNDKFCLDGERLIWDATNGFYRTQHESWQRVNVSDSSINPAFFTVTTKDGTVMTYGGTSNSQILAKGQNIIRIWALNRIQDSNGNYITISYNNQGNTAGEYSPDFIDYTGNDAAGVAPYNRVKFDYSTSVRLDAIRVYEGGSQINTTKLLIGVRSCADVGCASIVRKYTLDYTASGGVNQARMTNIHECGSDGVCLPSTDLTWLPSNLGYGGSYTSAGGQGWTYEAGRAWVDFNGDGKADYCRVVGTTNGVSSYVQCTVSTGKGFGPTYTSSVIDWGYDAGRAWVDFNGDGKADYCRNVGDATGSGAKVQCTVSTGAGFGATYTSAGGVGWTYEAGRTWVDFNGDGQADYCANVGDQVGSGANVRCATSLSTYNDIMTSITNGLGVQTTVMYKPLTDSSVYVRRTGATYPYQDVQDSTYVVSQVLQSNGIGNINTANYSYIGMQLHHEAATGIGFSGMWIMDATGNNYTAFNQTLDGTEGTVSQNYTWDINWQLVKYVNNTWTGIPFDGGRTLAQLSASTETNYVLGTTTSTAYSNYDTYGNAGSIVVNSTVGGVSDGWQKTTTNSYNNDIVNWRLGQLTQSQVTAAAPGQTALTRTSRFTYDSLGRLRSEVIEPNSAELMLTTSYSYDTFGNRIKKHLNATYDFVLAPRDEYTRQYDIRGQFPVWQTNALSRKTTYDSYDLRNGAVAHLTDPNGLPYTWVYNDGFARLTQETRPDNSTTTYTYQGCDITCPTLAKTMTATATSGAGTTWVYRDMLGREVRKQSQGFGGAWVYRDTAYDNLGRVISISEPYYSATTVYNTTYGYDVLNRVITVTEPGSVGSCNGPGRNTTTSYNGLSTTVTNPMCQTKTTVKDSQGHVVSVTDAAGTSQYQYDPFGNLTQVTAVDGAITLMTYDIRGRKATMRDPDMGYWSYYYDPLGELTTQIDAKQQAVGMNYDLLGRIKWRNSPEGTSTWTYDTAPLGTTGRPALGKLAQVSNSNATETYTYDNLARLNTDTTSIGGVLYTTSYSYDAYSRLLTLAYPETGFTLYHVYDAYANLTEVYQDNANGLRFWKANAVDARNRVTQESLGNGIGSSYVYDAPTADLLYSYSFLSGASSFTRYSQQTYDALDNLTARTWFDGTQYDTENFTYDNLNRLTAVAGPVPKTYAYYPNGNIQSKSDVGTYTYRTDGVQPHAVSAVAGAVNATYNYDANGNMLGGNGRIITYTSFNKPKTIANGSGTTTLTYDANYNRVIKTSGTGTVIYVGKLYERETNGSTVIQRHFVYAGPKLIGAYYVNNGTPNMKYFLTDHLGSVDTVTNSSGGVVARYSYDAHGKRRNANGTDALIGLYLSGARRGFTGHEHDDEVGLVNMNAREYDYVIGRFITPDTVVPGATNSQAYNRYSYAYNNPLSFTDPTGQWSLRKAVKKITRALHNVGERIHIDTAYRAYARYQVASAYVGAGFYLGGPTGAVAGARAFYESNKVYNAGGNTGDILTTGAASGTGTYFALEGVGGMYDSWINGIVQTQSMTLATAKVAGQQYVNAQFREAVGNYAARQGYSLTEFNLGLFGLSALGNVTVGSRLEQGTWDNTEWGIRGYGNRGELFGIKGIPGLPFDVVDTVLAYQGLPTATAVQYIFSSQRGMPLTGHSLGALDVANLSGFGLAGTSSRVYALPFGKVTSGAGTTIGSGDAINGFGLGVLFNPDAAVADTGFLDHACRFYPGCGQ